MQPAGSDFLGVGRAGGNHYGSTWTTSFQLLSGVPLGSAGLEVDRVYIAVALVPEPSTWAMLLLGFSAVGFIAYRRGQSGYRLRIA